jgi:hypothetical protein
MPNLLERLERDIAQNAEEELRTALYENMAQLTTILRRLAKCDHSPHAALAMMPLELKLREVEHQIITALAPHVVAAAIDRAYKRLLVECRDAG